MRLFRCWIGGLIRDNRSRASLRRCGFDALVTLCLAAALALPLPGQAPAAPTRAALNGTLVHRVETTAGRFDLTVVLPLGYRADGSVRYRSMYLLDGGLTLPLAWAIQRLLGFEDELVPVILVGVQRVTSNMSESLRSRVWDFTPWADTLAAKTWEPECVCRSGGADSLVQALAQSMLPLIDSLYSTDRSDRGLMGHSLSGLFGAHVLLNHPGMFSKYLLNAPSLLFSYTQLVQRLAALPAERVVATRLFLSDGTLGSIPDVPRFSSRAKASSAIGATEFVVFQGESHNSVVPAALSRGMRWLYGKP